MLGDPKACRDRALYCARRAATAASPVAREKFANLAKTWLHLATMLDEQSTLLDEWGVDKAAQAGVERLTKQRAQPLAARRVERPRGDGVY